MKKDVKGKILCSSVVSLADIASLSLHKFNGTEPVTLPSRYASLRHFVAKFIKDLLVDMH